MTDPTIHPLIIIGSGPAGYTAAIYAARANLSPLMFSGLQPGGQLTITSDVENFPGFPKGILGPEMMDLFREQAERFGTKIVQDEITHVDFSKRPFSVYQGNQTHLAQSVIIATGASAKLLGLPSEKALMGHGVSACATCDGFFFKNQEIAVVGGGDTALEEALFLTKFASKVTIIHRREALRASKIMQERAFKNPKVNFIWNSAVEEVLSEQSSKSVKGVRLKNLINGELTEFACSGLFIAIGHQPNTALFQNQLDLDANGYIQLKGATHTSVAGVFACGDVADSVYRQAITAAGTGCMAAIDAERFLAH